MPELSREQIIAILAWLGGGTVLGIIAWLFKIPRTVWNWFVLLIVFRHGNIPRRTLIAQLLGAQWHYGGVSGSQATQLHITLQVTNISDVATEIVQARFRQSWSRKWHPLPPPYGQATGARFEPHTYGMVVAHGFVLPRITEKPKTITGQLCLIDQFQNGHFVNVRIEPGPDVTAKAKKETTMNN